MTVWNLWNAHACGVACVRRDRDQKVLVFFQTAKLVDYFTKLFSVRGFRVERLTGRMSQTARTRVFFEFTKARGGILFSTNVSARGLDIPDIDSIVQIGIPESTEDYIHRIGRTARAGNHGRALLVMRPHERLFLQWLRKEAVQLAEIEPPQSRKMQTEPVTDPALAYSAYQSYLGYVNSNRRQWHLSLEQTIDEAKSLGAALGVGDFGVEKKTLRKMGIPLEYFSNESLPAHFQVQPAHVQDRLSSAKSKPNAHAYAGPNAVADRPRQKGASDGNNRPPRSAVVNNAFPAPVATHAYSSSRVPLGRK